MTILRTARPNRWDEHDIVHGKRHALWKCQYFTANLRADGWLPTSSGLSMGFTRRHSPRNPSRSFLTSREPRVESNHHLMFDGQRVRTWATVIYNRSKNLYESFSHDRWCFWVHQNFLNSVIEFTIHWLREEKVRTILNYDRPELNGRVSKTWDAMSNDIPAQPTADQQAHHTLDFDIWAIVKAKSK